MPLGHPIRRARESFLSIVGERRGLARLTGNEPESSEEEPGKDDLETEDDDPVQPEAIPPWWEEFGTDFEDEPEPEPGDFWPSDDDDEGCHALLSRWLARRGPRGASLVLLRSTLHACAHWHGCL